MLFILNPLSLLADRIHRFWTYIICTYEHKKTFQRLLWNVFLWNLYI